MLNGEELYQHRVIGRQAGVEEDPANAYSCIEDVKITQHFIGAFKNVTPYNGGLSDEAIAMLLKPTRRTRGTRPGAGYRSVDHRPI